ncbi:MAG: trigger factor [Elusimicrobiales bacterium]
MPTQIQTETMEIKRLSQKGCAVRVGVSASDKYVAAALQNALVQVQAQAQIPGFRKGKAPLNMVRENFAALVKERAFDNVLRAALGEIITRENLKPVDSPALEKCEFTEGKPFSAEFEFEIPPQFEAKNYKKIPVVSRKIEIGEDKIAGAIKEILGQHARLHPAPEGAAVDAASFAVIDYEAFKPGSATADHSSKNELVDMAEPQTLGGLQAALLGAKKGDTREFDAEVGGGKYHIKAAVTDIKTKTVPELTDAFAKELGFESEQQFREHVKSALLRQAQEDNRRDAVRQIHDFLLKEHSFDLPQSLVEHHLGEAVERLGDRMHPEELKKLDDEKRKQLGDKLRPAVERDMKLGYIISAIASAEKLENCDEEYEAEVGATLARARSDEERRKMQLFFEKRRDEVLSSLLERKVEDFMHKNAVITEG